MLPLSSQLFESSTPATFPAFNNLIPNTITPKTVSLQSNNDSSYQQFFPSSSSNPQNLQYYLTPSPKYMAGANHTSVQTMIPEKHRLLHKSSKSLGIQQTTINKKQEQQLLLNSSSTSNSNLSNVGNQNNNIPIINQHFQKSHQQTSNRILNASYINNSQHFIESVERSKSSNNMLAVSSQTPSQNHQQNIQGYSYICQDNIHPIVSLQGSNSVSSFLSTVPFQDKENQHISTQAFKPRDTNNISSSRLPLTPIQRIQEKHKPTRKSKSPAGCVSYNKELIDSQCIQQTSSKTLEGVLQQQNSQIYFNRVNKLLANNSKNSSSQIMNSSTNQIPSNFNKLSLHYQHPMNNQSLEDTSNNNNNNSKKSQVPMNPFFKSPIAVDSINTNNNNNTTITSSLFLNNNLHRNNHAQDRSTKQLNQKILSPRIHSNPRYSTTALTEDAITAINTLPSMKQLQSPRRQTLSLYAERCNTTESEYQQYQKVLWDTKTEESMIEQGTSGDSKIVIGGRSISCSDSVMRNNNNQYYNHNLNRNINSQINCIRIENPIDSTEDAEQEQQLLTEVSSIKQRNRQLVMQEAQDRKQQQDAFEEIVELKKEIEQLRISDKRKQQDHDNIAQAMKEQINVLSKDLHCVEQRIKEMEEENISLKESKETLILEKDTHIHQLAECNQKIYQLEQINLKSQHQEDISACNNRWNQEQQGILLTQADNMRAEITSQKLHIADLSQLLAESQNASNEMNNRIQDLQGKLKAMELAGQESQSKVNELQSKMIGMSEKAKEAAEKAKEASIKLVAVTEDANRLREEVQELQRNKNEIEQYQKEYDVVSQSIKQVMKEFAERILICSNKTELEESKEDLEKHMNTNELVNDLMLFSEGLRRLIDETDRRKELLAQKDRIINQHEIVARELEKEIQGFQMGKYTNNEIVGRQMISQKMNDDNIDSVDQDEQNKNNEEQIGIISRFNSVIVEGSYQSNNQQGIEIVQEDKEYQQEDNQCQQKQQQQQQQQQQDVLLLSIPKKIQEYIEKEQRLFEQTFRDRMADVEKEMFKQMHEKDQQIRELSQEKIKISEVNEQRLVEQKILQTHLDRKQEECIRSIKAIEELQKRLRDITIQTGRDIEKNSQDVKVKNQIKEQSQTTGIVALRDRRLAIDSIEEENEESIDEDAFETLNTYNSIELQDQQQQQQQSQYQQQPLQEDEEQSQLSQEYQSIQQKQKQIIIKDLQLTELDKQYYQEAMQWKTKVDEKRKVITKLRRELDKYKGKLLDMEERQFNLESLNRRITAELETVKASSQDVPKLIDMLKARKVEYVELKRRFDVMKQERDQAVKVIKGNKERQLNQNSVDMEYSQEYGINTKNNNIIIQNQQQQQYFQGQKSQQSVRKETIEQSQQQKTQQELSSERQRNSKDITIESKSQFNSLIDTKQQNKQKQPPKQQQQQYLQLRSHSLSVERTQNLNAQ